MVSLADPTRAVFQRISPSGRKFVTLQRRAACASTRPCVAAIRDLDQHCRQFSTCTDLPLSRLFNIWHKLDVTGPPIWLIVEIQREIEGKTRLRTLPTDQHETRGLT